MNQAYIDKHPVLGTPINDSKFFGFVLERLEASNYLAGPKERVEMTGAIFAMTARTLYALMFMGGNRQPRQTALRCPFLLRVKEKRRLRFTHIQARELSQVHHALAGVNLVIPA